MSLDDFLEDTVVEGLVVANPSAEEACERWVREQLAQIDQIGLDDSDDEEADLAIEAFERTGVELFGRQAFDEAQSAVLLERRERLLRG